MSSPLACFTDVCGYCKRSNMYPMHFLWNSYIVRNWGKVKAIDQACDVTSASLLSVQEYPLEDINTWNIYEWKKQKNSPCNQLYCIKSNKDAGRKCSGPRTVCHKGHASIRGPCFHKKYMEAGVMTFAADCTRLWVKNSRHDFIWNFDSLAYASTELQQSRNILFQKVSNEDYRVWKAL